MRGVPPPGLPRHERPAWSLAYKAARLEGSSDHEARGHAAGVLHRVRRDVPQARGQALLDAADTVHRSACKIIAIKANPPTYEVTVGTLGDLLTRLWADKASPPVGVAVQELADIASSEDPAVVRWTKGKARVAQLADELKAAGATLSDADTSAIGRLLATAYRLGKKEISEPLGYSVDFTLPDRDAIHGLHNSGLYWIGKKYGEALDTDKLLETVKDTMLTQGLGRTVAGHRLAQAFGGQLKASEGYWTGLAATVATRARSFGAIEAMRANGGRRYEFINPDDEVTSDVCRALNGTTWSVPGAVALRDKLLSAASPEEWKAASPWPKAREILTPAGQALHDAGALKDKFGRMDPALARPHLRASAELQAAGIAWPPLHFHCRSSIVVRIWWPLSADDVDPLADVEPKAYAPPVKKPKAKPVVDHVPAPLTPPPWHPSLPAGLCPEPFDLDFNEANRAWRALFRLQGYTDDEVAALGALDLGAGGFLPQGANQAEKLTDLFFASDRETIAAIMAKHPPAAPRAFQEFGWLPPIEALGQKNEQAFMTWAETSDSSAIGPWFKAAFYGEKGKKAEVVSELFASPAAGGELEGLMGAGYNPQEKIEVLAFLEDLAKKGDDEAVIKAIQTIADDGVPYPWKVPGAQPKPIGSLPAPKAPPASAVAVAPIPPPPPGAPAAVAQLVEDLPAGTLEAHPGYDWHPTALWAKDPTPELWQVKLGINGYTNDEIRLLWGTAKAPGPLAKVADELEELRKAAGWAKGSEELGQATQARFAGVLVKYPPAKVVGANGRPGAFLSPAELGARLTPGGDLGPMSSELGKAFRDQLDSETWIVAEGVDEAQARRSVVAAALYRRLGVEAGDVRLVNIGGKITSATRKPGAWSAVSSVDDLAQAHGAELARTMPADAWMGAWNTFGTGDVHVLTRDNPIPGLGSGVMRGGLRSVFDRRFTGGIKPAGSWTGAKVDELETFLDAVKAPRGAVAYARAAEDRSLLLPMMDRIGALDDAEIDAALALGDLPAAEAHELRSVLIGRARWMRDEAARLRAQLVQEAAERAAAAERLLLEAARREKLRADLLERIARGEVVPGMVRDGLDLESLAATLEKEGSAAVAGDHGIVREQAIRVTRYRSISGKSTKEDGFEVVAMLDSTSFDDVNARLRAIASKAGNTKGKGFRSWQRKVSKRGAVIQYDHDAVSDFLGDGLWVETPRASIDFAGAVGEAETQRFLSMEGRIRIRLKNSDPKAAQRELAAVLRDLGLDDLAAAPSAESRQNMALNRAAWNVLGKGYKAHARGHVLSPEDAARALKKAGVDTDAITIEANGARGYQTVRIEDRWRKYRKKDRALFLYHEIADRNGVLGVMGRQDASGEAGGLLATTERYLDGVFKNGASSGRDMTKGPGGAHVFTRLVGEESSKGNHSRWYGGFGDHRAILHPDILDRVDWYHNRGDGYGVLEEGRMGADAAIAELSRTGSSTHEVMFRATVKRRSILFWSASDAQARNTILEAARENGITTWHGHPIERMVVVMKSPRDFSGLDKSNPIHAFAMGLRDDLDGIHLDD